MADWYYIGHYGQLGPLTLEQIEELVQSGVIVRETYVWHSGMSQWQPAEGVAEIRNGFANSPFSAPPAPPAHASVPPLATANMPPPAGHYSPYGAPTLPASLGGLPSAYAMKSDKSRVAGGILNIILPGVGRMYLGYAAVGVIQLFVSIITCGIGSIWPLIDGIMMLVGSVKYDGYGRILND